MVMLQKSGEKQWFQILAIFLACITSMIAGMLYSWSSPSIPRIVADKENYNITFEEASYFAVLPPIGTIVSCFFYAKLIDLIGRKNTLLSIAIPQIIALVITATSTSLYVLYTGRFLVGFADACLFTALPVYVAEVATPKLRGTWGNLMSFFMYFGQLAINVIGSYTTVTETAWITLTLPVLFWLTFYFMPETPYFYLMQNRLHDARSSLRQLRRSENVERELFQLQIDVNRQMSESGSWGDLFGISSNRKALYAAIFLRASQPLAGISAFSVYTQYIFQRAGSNISASSAAIILMALCTVLNLCATFTLDHIGRRKSYFLSTFLCGFALLSEALYFALEHLLKNKIDFSIVQWIPLAGMILYMIFYSFGLGIVPTLMLGELFSVSVKSKGLLLLNIVAGVLVSICTKLFQTLDACFGLFAPFLFFSVCCFISSFLSLYFVPETRGKTLEEIQQLLKDSEAKSYKSCDQS